jgi:hypothetical protein
MPSQVRIAVALLCIHVAVSLVVHAPRLVDIANAAPPKFWHVELPLWLGYAGWDVFVGLIIYFIVRGNHPARIALFVVVIVEALFMLVAHANPRANSLPIWVVFGGFALRWTALVLVFSNPADAWFKRGEA